jgi:hypothetical protein
MEIYKITNLINSKIYIGKDTTSDPKYFGSGILIRRSIQKYGLENFSKEVIDTADNKEELAGKEKYWISEYNSIDKNIGYNISKGGDGGDTISWNPNRDLINKKVSESSFTKGKTYEEAYGIEKSLEYKRKLSEALKKRKPREKKEKIIKLDGRKERWIDHYDNKEKNKDKLFKELLKEIRESGINDNIEKIEDFKKNRIKLGISSVEKFYQKFEEFETEIRKYYKGSEYNNRSLSYTGRILPEEAKVKIKNKKIEKARKDFQVLIETIEKNSIEILEDYFTKKESVGIRKRFLKGTLKNEIPDKYKKIIEKLPKNKSPVWTEESKKSWLKKMGKGIEIDGVKYDSISGAAKEMGIDRNWVRYKISTGKWPDKYNNKL